MPARYNDALEGLFYAAVGSTGISALKINVIQEFLNDWLTVGIGVCTLIVVGHKAIRIVKGRSDGRKRKDPADL